MPNIDACLTSKTAEHYTPPSFLIRVYEFFGGTVDLDPCSNSLESPTVLANAHYTQALDGLSLPWFGKVFVNPPYGRTLMTWTEKLCSEYEQGNISEAIYLVPSRTDTKWTRRLSAYARCYLDSRLKFTSREGIPQDSAPFPSAVFYLGNRLSDFESYWQSQGEVWLPHRQTKFDKVAYQREYMRKRRASHSL